MKCEIQAVSNQDGMVICFHFPAHKTKACGTAQVITALVCSLFIFYPC